MTFVDPISLNLPSSPTSSDDAGPSRKRPRSELSSEERKEARAHRNRIAAQNSRDKRKAQFSYLERRVAELEEENKRLRAGIVSSPAPSMTEESSRDKENEELKERIRTLEMGWDAVLKALAAQGLPLQLNPPAPAPALSVQPATSPAVSTVSLDSDMSLSASTPASPEPQQDCVTEEDSTRHLAAGGFQPMFTFNTGSSYQATAIISPITPQSPSQAGFTADPTIESLFREILVDQPETQVASPAAVVEALNQKGPDHSPHFEASEETKASSAFEEMNLEAYSMESPESSSSLLFGISDSALDINVDLDFDNDELKRLLDEYCSVPPLTTPTAPTPLAVPEGLSVF